MINFKYLQSKHEPYSNFVIEISNDDNLDTIDCDLFYFCNDGNFLSSREDYVKGTISFLYHLHRAKSRISLVTDGTKQFLPLDFSDEYLGGILFNKVQTGIFKASIVTTQQVTGPGIWPSQSLDFNYDDNRFVSYNTYLVSSDEVFSFFDNAIGTLFESFID